MDAASATVLARRRGLTRRLAWLAALVMLTVVGLSAFIRLVHAPLPGIDAAAYADAVTAARAAHRLSASLLLVFAFTLLLATLVLRPRLRREGALAAGIVLCTLWLAGLGIATRGSTAPAVVLGNLGGGFLMFALCLRLAAVAAGEATAATPLQRPARWALLAMVLAVALGALLSAAALPLACDGWSACLAAARDVGWNWQVLLPATAALPADAPAALQRGAWLPLLHGATGLLALLTLLRLDWTAWRQRARVGIAPFAVLVALELLLLASVLLPPGLAQALVHNLASALLLGWLARLA